jgi:arsenical pump membrane protein
MEVGLGSVAAVSVLALTVTLSLSRPRIGSFRIHHAQASLIGAALTILLGIAPPDMLVVAARILALPVLTIVSLMIITLIAERAGLFDVLARAIARGARGSGGRLFALIFVTGTIVGTFFTNDAAVLIFTPLVFGLIERVSAGRWTLGQKLPFYFSVLYVGNLVGALVIANPINVVVSSLFSIGFVEYARWMVIPAAVSIAVSFAGLWIFFGASVPRRFELPAEPVPEEGSRRRLRAYCAIALSLTLVGFFAEAWTTVPTWLVAFSGAIALLLLHSVLGRGGVRPIFRGVGWDVIAFLCGMFVVGMGLRNAGLTTAIGDAIRDLSSNDASRMRLATGLIAAVCSAVINNHPTAGIMAWTIQDFRLPELDTKLLAFSALVGGDLGPKMLPIGSLAALMWFRLLRDRGVEIPYGLYVRIGIPVTLAAVVASLLALNLESWLMR